MVLMMEKLYPQSLKACFKAMLHKHSGDIFLGHRRPALPPVFAFSAGTQIFLCPAERAEGIPAGRRTVKAFSGKVKSRRTFRKKVKGQQGTYILWSNR